MFISHRSTDSVRAARIKRLLEAFGHENVFLDVDPEGGLTPGGDFASQLADRHARASLYIFLLSEAWLQSSWCLAEYKTALLGKGPRIVIAIEDMTHAKLPPEIGAEQILKWAAPDFAHRFREAVDKKVREAAGKTRSRAKSSVAPPSARGETPIGLGAFRDRVARSLALSGYEPSDAITLSRGAIDFIGQRTDPLHVAKIAVCCWPEASSAVAREMFEECIAEARAKLPSLGCVELLICHAGALPGDLMHAHDGIGATRLISLSDLEATGTRYRDYLKGVGKKYRSYLARTFVDLDAAPRLAQHAGPIRNVAETLSRQLLKGETQFAFLLGDFGSGKTTIGEQIHRIASERYLAGQTTIFPMIFYLRTLALFATEEKFLQHQISESAPGVPPTLLDEMRQRGEVLFILDGFDEVASNSTLQERKFYFSRIFELAARCDRLLLTSRPTVFTNFGELNALVDDILALKREPVQSFRHSRRRSDRERGQSQEHNANLLSQRYAPSKVQRFPMERTLVAALLPLEEHKILEFFAPHEQTIKSRHKKTPEEVYKILLDVYDLTDILTRPLLLEMFIFLLVDGDIDLDDPQLEVGAVWLYQQYIERHLARENERSPYLPKPARRDFAAAAASAMLRAGGTLEASFGAIEAIVRQMAPESFANIDMNLEFEKIVTDVRNSGFLTITPDDKVAFTHKSFMEFFIADTIYQKISNREYVEELDEALNYEILQFVGGFAMARQEFRIVLSQHLSHLKRAVSPRYAMNVSIALLYADVRPMGLTFRDIDADSLVLRRQEFNTCRFEGVVLGLVDIDRCAFNGCHFQGVALLGQVRASKFQNCGGDIDFERRLGDVEIADSILSIGTTERLEDLRLTNSDLTVQMFDGALDVDNCAIASSALQIDGQTKLNLTRCELDRALLCFDEDGASRQEHLLPELFSPGSSRNKSRCRASAVHALPMSDDEYFRLEHGFKDWSGLFVIDDPKEKIDVFYHSAPGGGGVKRFKGWHYANGRLLVSTTWWRRNGASLRALRTELVRSRFYHSNYEQAMDAFVQRERQREGSPLKD